MVSVWTITISFNESQLSQVLWYGSKKAEMSQKNLLTVSETRAITDPVNVSLNLLLTFGSKPKPSSLPSFMSPQIFLFGLSRWMFEIEIIFR